MKKLITSLILLGASLVVLPHTLQAQILLNGPFIDGGVSPGQIYGTSTNLSIVAVEPGYTNSDFDYFWLIGSGNTSARPTISSPVSGPGCSPSAPCSNAQNPILTFNQVGFYIIYLTVTNRITGETASSSGTSQIFVNPTPGTTILIQPNPGAAEPGQSASFQACVEDQFGNCTQNLSINYSWATTVPGSTITFDPVHPAIATFHAGANTPLLRYADGVSASAPTKVTGKADVIIDNPTVTATANPNPVITGKTTTLTAIGMDPVYTDPTTLSYLWTYAPVAPTPASSVVDFANSVSAKTVATFHHAGTYKFTVTMTNPIGLTASANVSVVVDQDLGSGTIDVNPKNQQVTHGLTQQYTATANDQFGDPFLAQSFTWTVTSAFPSITIISNGLLTGGNALTPNGTPFTVTAAAGGTTGSAAGTIVNAPPTILGITANPNPTSTKTSVLTVSASDPDDTTNSLTYTWSGPVGVSFTTVGPSNNPQTTATFPSIGTFTINVVVKDPAGNQVSGTKDVTVIQGASGINVTPNNQHVLHGQTQGYTATVVDQFGNSMATQPASFAWSSTLPTTINPTSGLLTAGTASTPAGTFTVTATAVSLTGSANGFIDNAAPNVPVITANPNPTTTKTSDLTVSATDPDDATAALTYTWSGPSGVTFTTVGPTTSVNTTATFPSLGTFHIKVIVTDPAGNQTPGFVDISVVQGATSIDVSPKNKAVVHNTTQPYTATVLDQFGNPLTTQPGPISWTSTLPTTVDAAGLLTAGTATTPAGPFTVTATFNTLSGSTNGTITNAAPHVPTITASPNPTFTTSTNITFSDDDVDDVTTSLTYQWTLPVGVTMTHAGPANLSVGNNFTTATFPALGTYTLTLTVTDPAGDSSSNSVQIVVKAGVTAINVNPKNQQVVHGQTQSYTASAIDQFNNPITVQPPTFIWTVTSAFPSITIISNGLLTGGNALTPNGTPFTVTAAAGGTTGSAAGTIVNAPPTILGITANPNPTSTKTSVLTVSASDPDDTTNSLTYTWSGPVGVSFTTVGPSNNPQTTATFPSIGTFTINVVVKDPAGNQVSGTKDVTVIQGASGINVTPNNQHVLHGQTQGYTATVVDQFGNSMATQPASFAWSSTLPTTINPTSGLLTAGTASTPAGTFTVTATAVSLTGSANGFIDNAAPNVPVITANPNPTTTKTSDLTVSATDPDDATAALTYTWSGPSGVTFTTVGPTTSVNTTATFPSLGTFHIKVIVTDPAGNQTPGFVDISVVQGATSIDVSPKNKAVVHNTTQPYTATVLDQFGNPLTTQPGPISWTSTLPTTVDAAGLLTAGTATTPAGPFTVTATFNTLSGSTNGTITNAAPHVIKITASANPTTTGSTVLTFSAADDDDATTSLTFQWTTTQGATFSNPSGNLNATTNTTTVTFPVLDTYHLVLTVTDPAGNQGTASIDVIAANPPALVSLDPSSKPALSDAFTLTVTGINFVPDSVILWDGDARPTTYISATQVKATIPSTDLKTIRVANVSVANYGLRLPSTNNLPFSIYGVLTKVLVDPDGKSISLGDQLQFTARSYNQLGQEIPNQSYHWQTVGESGSISTVGLFRSPTDFHGKSIFTIEATNSGVTGIAHVTVYTGGVPQNDICGVIPYPVPYKSNSGLPGVTFTRMAPGTSVRIYSIDSRLVQTLTSPDGEDVLWDVHNSGGEKVASGVYFYLLNQNGSCPSNKGKLVIIQ